MMFDCDQRDTWVLNPGEGVAQIFAWDQGYLDKIANGIRYLGFYCIFISNFLKICLGVGGYITSPYPPHSL